MDTSMTQTNPLRLRRIAKGMTQSAVAAAAGVSQQFLSKLENGRAQINAEKATLFAGILGCRPAELLPALTLTPQPDTEGVMELELLMLFRRLSPHDRSVYLAIGRTLEGLETPKAASSQQDIPLAKDAS